MKKIMFFLGVILLAMSAFIPRNPSKSGIYGTIDPPDGAKKIWAVNGRDSASAVTATGRFSLDLKPGTWRLVVQAVSPYKDILLDNILVQENQYTDAGVIKLQQ